MLLRNDRRWMKGLGIKKVVVLYPDHVEWCGWHQQVGTDLVIKVDGRYPSDIRPLVAFHEEREHYYMNIKEMICLCY